MVANLEDGIDLLSGTCVKTAISGAKLTLSAPISDSLGYGSTYRSLTFRSTMLALPSTTSNVVVSQPVSGPGIGPKTHVAVGSSGGTIKLTKPVGQG